MPNRQEGSNDREVLSWDLHMDLAAKVLGTLNGVSIEGTTARSVQLLTRRVYDGTVSLRTLQRHAPHAWSLDGAVILRGIYDAGIQLLYILSQLELRDERAQCFADFMSVEKRKTKSWALRSKTVVAESFRKNVLERPGAFPPDSQLERTFAKFRTKKGNLRQKWYKGNLCDLAGAVGFRDECELLQPPLSAAVHSSFMTLTQGPLVQGHSLLTYAWTVMLRVFRRVLEYHDISCEQCGLNRDQRDAIAQSYQPMFD